jgi:DedD protein
MCNHTGEFACRCVAAARYTLRVERQLKERLIGAAVLFALAVVLVPEMFSGPATRAPESAVARDDAASQAATDQIKTWHVDLQSAAVVSESSSEPLVEAPAAAPRDEAQTESASVSGTNESRITESSASSVEASSASSIASAASSGEATKLVVSKPVPLKPATASKPEALKSTPTPEANGKWQVQIGSFGAEDKARQIAAQLKSKGFPASVSTVKAGGKTLYRVRVSGGSSRESAQATLKKLSGAYSGASLVAPDK